ncbi:MAG TPA: hypothetical protein VM432_03525 [Bdellovibrionales bacterium]|nr:hypothetical protein [Bdellovibrionales bacterium]
MLLVFPQENRKEPRSLWYEFFPKTKMRWEWDDDGDSRVADLWHLRAKLSTSRKVIYSKWFRGRATVMAFDVFTAMVRVANPNLPRIDGLSFQAREILDLLEEDSPLSTKQLKRMTGLQGRSSEAVYQRSLKELWDRNLIVAFGEVDEGAFPSLAVGATKTLFEDLYLEACEMSVDTAAELLAERLEPGSPFERYWKSLLKRWEKEL